MEDRGCYLCQKIFFVGLNLSLTIIGVYFVVSGAMSRPVTSVGASLAMVGAVGSAIGALGFISACFESYKMLFSYGVVVLAAAGVQTFFFMRIASYVSKGKHSLSNEDITIGFLSTLVTIEVASVALALRMALIIRRERMYYDRY